ncbi:MAG: leucine-rich repeat domain-containing protein [Bacteroidaceae bacterium]|nr:leucine-rich repeat domain-containing protein [Bacteroidaceae bacterium]
MRKLLFSFLLLLTSVVCRAYDFEVDGIYYQIESRKEHTVAVTNSTNEYVGSIVIPESVTCNSVTYSVTTIMNSAFSGCSGLTSITIPNSVTTISEGAFARCSRLTSITIPNSVTTISEGAFATCSRLTSITIPNSVTSIGEDAFSFCDSLTSITIPNSVTTISKHAFFRCKSLTSITIPNSVKNIGEMAFSKCYALKNFYCHAESVPTTGSYIFYYVNLSSATLHVPEASLQEYGSTAPWSEFGQIVALTESDGIKPLASEEKKPTTVYSLDGRRVAKPRKGIYVIGGRKTAVR